MATKLITAMDKKHRLWEPKPKSGTEFICSIRVKLTILTFYMVAAKGVKILLINLCSL